MCFFLIKISKIFSTFIFLELKLKFQVFSTDSDQLNLRYQTINIKNLKTKNVYLKTVMVTLLNTFVISIFFAIDNNKLIQLSLNNKFA